MTNDEVFVLPEWNEKICNSHLKIALLSRYSAEEEVSRSGCHMHLFEQTLSEDRAKVNVIQKYTLRT